MAGLITIKRAGIDIAKVELRTPCKFTHNLAPFWRKRQGLPSEDWRFTGLIECHRQIERKAAATYPQRLTYTEPKTIAPRERAIAREIE